MTDSGTPGYYVPMYTVEPGCLEPGMNYAGSDVTMEFGAYCKTRSGINILNISSNISTAFRT